MGIRLAYTPVMVELLRIKGTYTQLNVQWPIDSIRCIGDTSIYKTLCFIYPKGKRPDLGYPVNNKIEEK